ncbi:heme biosynthesis HemY N-terminal domain-containing protein [uncultured Abyssibacter sp.]|uniref:heme biosynthesis HemY N-terminal domain-containing protein n=1 Tax=uncultured Abyssibacter sp. TaxID=2320202 RepID=UPI0032B23983
MMRILLLVLVFAAAAAAGVYLLGDSGYVLINLGAYIVETSVVTLIVVALGGGLLLMFAWRALRGGIRAPGAIRQSFRQRRMERARTSYLRGMLRLTQGRPKDAEVDLVRHAAHHDYALLNYLGAAEAADAIGAFDRRDRYLELAYATRPDAELSVLMKQADLQTRRGRHAESLATLVRLRDLHPHHPGVLRRLVDVYEQSEDWEPLRLLLEQIERESVIPDERWQMLMQTCYLRLLESAGEHRRLDSVHGAWETVSKRFRGDATVRRGYIRQLARCGADGEAIALITQALKAEWDAELVLLFGEMRASDDVSQLAVVEQWLRQYDERPELLLVAGRLCLRARLWGRARSYLEASLTKRKSPDTLFALARLAEETKESDRARGLYREGLELALES